MMSQEEINRLREIPIENVAERLGMTVRRGRCLCPFHDDTNPSMMFRRGKNSYHCFVCGASGSGPIDLVMKKMRMSFTEACRWLADESGGTMAERQGRSKTYRKTLAPQDEVVTDREHLENIMRRRDIIAEAKTFLYEDRRISREVVEWLGLSSTARPLPMSRNVNGGWYNAPSILIPYRDMEGKLITLQARYLGKDAAPHNADAMTERRKMPRFQFPKGSRSAIYNMPVLATLEKDEPLFITEGCSDCWAMMTAGYKAIAIPSATLLKKEDTETLQRVLEKTHSALHICPDRDKPGERLYLELKEIFPKIIRHQLPEGYKDFGQWWAERKC